ARAATFVSGVIFLAHAQREVRVVVEEERGDVVVEDVKQNVGLVLCQPVLNGLVALEDRLPDRILMLLRVERETDGGGMRGGDPTDDPGHCLNLPPLKKTVLQRP